MKIIFFFLIINLINCFIPKINKKLPSKLIMNSKNGMTSGGFGNNGKPPFEIRGFSLADTTVFTGSIITLSSFAEYFNLVGSEGSISSIGFIYGLPITLIGSALKYAELKPVPVKATKEAETLFHLKKTSTIEQINSDVTRHRYGDEAHLDSTVKALGLVIPFKKYPQLQWQQYNISSDNQLEFMMVWKSKDTPFKMWNSTEKINKYDTFFGPNIKSEVIKINSEEKLVGIKLTTEK